MISCVSMLKRLFFAVLFALTGAATAVAAPAATLAPAAEPLQFYVFSFTDAPAAEAAADVVTGALAHDLEVDPAVDAIVSFRADGWYSEDALLRDFGTALLDEDIALVRTGPGAYALVPRVNAPMLMARGGTVMRLAEPQTTRPAVGLTPTDGDPRSPSTGSWWDGTTAALLMFFAGAAAGAAALFGGQIAWRQAGGERARLAPPVLRLTDQRLRFQQPVEAVQPDPDLVIPRFEERR